MMSLLLALRRGVKDGVLLYTACALLFAAPIVAQPSPLLTPKDIDEAIQWGLTGVPSPYLLHHEDGRPGSGVDSDVVGVI